MSIPDDLRYTNDHEWLRQQGSEAVVGITHHAQDQLGDVVFVDLPEVGRVLKAGDPFGTVESVKAVSDLFAPVSGKITAVNEALTQGPDVINRDPYGEGWMIRLAVSDGMDALLSSQDYQKLLEKA
jgi:glycine cleavage system H protein